MDEQAVLRAVSRMARQLVEQNDGPSGLTLLGIQRRGVQIANLIQSEIQRAEDVAVPVGTLDITLYRDDLIAIGPRPVVGESSLPPEGIDALKQVKEGTNAPICVGERLYTRSYFLPILQNGLADYIMPDPVWTGGISELKKIATMSEAYYIPISPHDASGPINVMAGAQVMMTVPNFYKLEIHRYDLSGYDILIDDPLDLREGHLHLPDRPGLGVNLIPEILEQYEVARDSE